jgi:tetratricopeptide (TPR) repeat protein
VNHSYARTLSLLALFALPLRAADIAVVRGRLQSPGTKSFDGLFVSMEEIVLHSQIHRIDVRFDGSFEFRGVPQGDYVFNITDLHGHNISQQFVNIHEHMDELDVRLPDSGRTPSLPGKVSVAQLMHPPDKKAVQAFHTALRFSESGKHDAAVTALEKALSISPEFGEAHTNLAVQYIRLNQFALAAAESRRAMEIAGPDPVNLCNLAFSQFQLRQFADAEASARAALRLDKDYLQADLILGTVLALNRAARAEAVTHLERAAPRFPSAQKTLDAIRAAN